LSSFVVENARQEWAEGHRRLQADPARHDLLFFQVDVLLDELRRRIGENFTLAQLAELYAGAEAWSREALERSAAGPGWWETLATVEAAAFHLYSRAAIDYEP
jgi:hypothetical protein